MRGKERIVYACSILLLLVATSGCNLTYKVRNQYQEIEEVVHLPCGKITCELIGKGNSKFTFKQRFDIDGTVTVLSDSLLVYFNGANMDVRHHLKNGRSGITTMELRSEEVWEASFEMDKGVFDGDTIKIYGPEYVYCGGESITLDTMVYTFINTLRIHGVND